MTAAVLVELVASFRYQSVMTKVVVSIPIAGSVTLFHVAHHDLTVHPLEGYSPELGSALWMMEDTRSRTLRAVDGLSPDRIDAAPVGAGNSIGSLLYHLAVIEADWLYADILQVDYPDWLAHVFRLMLGPMMRRSPRSMVPASTSTSIALPGCGSISSRISAS